jgi:hypothetical protein
MVLLPSVREKKGMKAEHRIKGMIKDFKNKPIIMELDYTPNYCYDRGTMTPWGRIH